MTPVYMTRALTQDRHRELLRDAERRRLQAALHAGPGLPQRFAFRVSGWGRRPAVVAGHPAVMASAYEPSAT